jgi:hypothetical protein
MTILRDAMRVPPEIVGRVATGLASGLLPILKAGRDAIQCQAEPEHLFYRSNNSDGSGSLEWSLDNIALTGLECAYVDFLKREGIPVTAHTLNVGRALFRRDADIYRDPSFEVDDGFLVAGMTMAHCSRLDTALRAMDDCTRAKAMQTLKMIASQALSFDDEDGEEANRG